MPADDRELLAEAARVDALLGEIDALPDPVVRGQVAEIVTGLLALYGEALERMLCEIRAGGGPVATERILAAFANDELVAHLLLLHDLHPVSLEERVGRALEDVRPLLESHGRRVECLGLEDGIARVRVEGGGCPSTGARLTGAVEQALLEAAPDLARVVTESAADHESDGFIPLTALR